MTLSTHAGPTLWIRVGESRPVVEAHLRQVAGRFRAAGWKVVRDLEIELENDHALAVMNDAWVDPLPGHADLLARSDDPPLPYWRAPRLSGLPPPQGWNPDRGPFTALAYEKLVPARLSSWRRLPETADYFLVAPAGLSRSLLEEGLPPTSERVIVADRLFVFRHRDPADHERREIDDHVPSSSQIVVDVGCGSGRLGTRLRREGREVIGIEPDPELAARARSRLDRVLVMGARAGLESLESRPDCVIFADVLEHLDEPESVLALVAERLADEGRVVLSLPNLAWAPIMHALAAGRWDPTISGVQARDHRAFFTPLSFASRAAEAGLEIVETIEMPVHLPLRLRLWSRLLALSVGGNARSMLSPQWIAVLARAGSDPADG